MVSVRPDNPIFQPVPDGRLLAIRNWRHRSHRDDALLAIPLAPDELARYRAMKDEGASDEAIFDALFAPRLAQRAKLPMEELTKPQLLAIARQLAQAALPSLERLSHADLVALVRSLAGPGGRCELCLV